MSQSMRVNWMESGLLCTRKCDKRNSNFVQQIKSVKSDWQLETELKSLMTV